VDRLEQKVSEFKRRIALWKEQTGMGELERKLWDIFPESFPIVYTLAASKDEPIDIRWSEGRDSPAWIEFRYGLNDPIKALEAIIEASGEATILVRVRRAVDKLNQLLTEMKAARDESAKSSRSELRSIAESTSAQALHAAMAGVAAQVISARFGEGPERTPIPGDAIPEAVMGEALNKLEANYPLLHQLYREKIQHTLFAEEMDEESAVMIEARGELAFLVNESLTTSDHLTHVIFYHLIQFLTELYLDPKAPHNPNQPERHIAGILMQAQAYLKDTRPGTETGAETVTETEVRDALEQDPVLKERMELFDELDSQDVFGDESIQKVASALGIKRDQLSNEKLTRNISEAQLTVTVRPDSVRGVSDQARDLEPMHPADTMQEAITFLSRTELAIRGAEEAMYLLTGELKYDRGDTKLLYVGKRSTTGYSPSTRPYTHINLSEFVKLHGVVRSFGVKVEFS